VIPQPAQFLAGWAEPQQALFRSAKLPVLPQAGLPWLLDGPESTRSRAQARWPGELVRQPAE
jgi:hypothetical protein